MSNQEQGKQMTIERSREGKNQLGVRVTVEFTGHLEKAELERFTQALTSVLVVHVENGGGG